MEKIFFDLREGESFVVHLNKDEKWKDGDVYPINKYIGTENWGYQAQKDGGHLDTTEGARCLFGFLFCWRGVWEGRIYFKDDEYWSEELGTIKELWEEIEKNLKARMKTQFPGNYYDE